MIRHAADSDKFKPVGKIKRQNYFERMPEVITEIVKQGITKSAADYHTEHCPDEIVLYSFGCIFIVFIFYPVESQKINNSESDKVHHTVIA